MGVSLLSTDAGYRGVAISAATGAILLGVVRLRRFPEDAPLVLVSSWAMLILACGCTILAAIAPLPWSAYAVLGAALFALGAAVIPLDRYRAVRTLGGIASIGIGVSLVADGIPLLGLDRTMVVLLLIANLTTPLIAGGMAIIGIGISLIGAGLALLLGRTALLGVAGVGLGGSLIGTGIALLSFPVPGYGGLTPWLIAAGVVCATGAGVACPLVRSTLLGVADVGLGVSLISAGVVLLFIPAKQTEVAVVIVAVSLISAGVAAIGAGVAFLLAQGTLTAVAFVAFGISLISAGIAVQLLGWTILAVSLIAPGMVAISAGVAFLIRRVTVGVACVGFGISLIGSAIAALFVQGTLDWVVVMFIDGRVVAALGTGVAIGAWIAIGAGVTALAAGVALPLARDTLTGIAGICLGLSLIGAGVAAGLVGAALALYVVWLIGIGVSLIALAVARLRDKHVLGGAAAIGFGISLAVLAAEFFLSGQQLGGVATIGASLAAIGTGVSVYASQTELRKWLSNRWAAWTRTSAGPQR